MKASFILSTYKTPLPLLKRAVNSFFSQTEKDLELIILNSGDEEDVDSYLRSIEGNNVVYVRNPGIYLDESRHMGIEIARGEYIGFLDADDYMENNLAETMLKALIETGADIADCSFYVEGKRRFKNPLRKTDRILSKHKAFKYLVQDIFIRSFVWTKMIKASLLSNEKCFYNYRHYYEDLPFSARAFLKANKVVYLQKPLYHYEKNNPSSITSTGHLRRPSDHIDSFLLAKRLARDSGDPKFLKIINRAFLRCKISVGYDLSLAKKAGMEKSEIKRLRKHFLSEWEEIK